MTAVVWPFPPREEMIEELQFSTDVMRAKAGEQRISMRTSPRRTFQLAHSFTDLKYSHARSLIRDAQGADGFLVPDWGQLVTLGAVSAGSSVAVTVDVSIIHAPVLFGRFLMLLWESPSKFEIVLLTFAGTSLAVVAGSYTHARLMPLWGAKAPESLSNNRSAGRINDASIAMEVDSSDDLSATPPGATYRSLDVLDECPVVGGGSFDESIAWTVSAFGTSSSIAHYIRNRTIPDMTYAMRWQLFTRTDQFALKQWLHYRRGRQKAFWMSSRGKDLEPSATASGTTVKVFAFFGLTGLGRNDPFDIEIKTATTSYYRLVTSITAGTLTDGRATINMTLGTTLGVSLTTAQIERISYLRCTRLNSDRVELLHSAGAGMSVQVPLIEIPTP